MYIYVPIPHGGPARPHIANKTRTIRDATWRKQRKFLFLLRKARDALSLDAYISREKVPIYGIAQKMSMAVLKK